MRSRILVVGLLLTATAPVGAGRERPNVIVSLADDLGWVNLGCVSRLHRTPHFDKLVAGSRWLTSVRAASPVYPPAGAVLMTGKHPARLPVTDWRTGRSDLGARKLARTLLIRQNLPLEEETRAESLHAANYATASLGKSNREGLAALAADAPITHGFLATGGQTYIRDGAGKMTWHYPLASRDGWLLSDGRVLLAVNPSPAHPGGAAVVVARDGKVLLEYKGTQSEVNTIQPLDGGHILTTEAGNRPRLLELNPRGQVVADVPLKAQTANHHLQTRMSRKLSNGNYLVPQLLDKVVREYTRKGEIVWEVKTPNMPFTAIRLDDGNTLIGCTLGNLVIEVDGGGHTVWTLSNDNLPGNPINDACGVQRLPNGNTVVTSQHAQGNDVKLTEVKRDKTIVWTYRDPTTPSIHHFQILDTNGMPIEGRPLR